MAYAVKYLFKFQSSNGIVREIRVLQDGYSGSVIQRPLGRAPVIKKDQNGGVHGTSLTFYAECHIDREYIEFYTSDPKEYRVDVYAGSTLLWQGYITPELYSEPDIAPPYDVQVVATDGVGELKLYDFTPQGTVTLRSLLTYLLGYTGLSTDVNLISSLKPGSHGSGALLDMQICIDYLAGKTCYEALTYLLDTLHATITRWGGAWLLVRETNVTFTNDKVRYFNTSGNSALLAGSVQTLGAMRSAPAWPVGQLSTVIDPAKNKVVVQAPWHPVTCLANPDMASDTGWTKANNASYGPDGYLLPNNDTGGSTYATAHISQALSLAGMRTPMSFELRATGVAAQVGARVGAVIGVLLTYTVGSTVYLLRKGDEGTPVWKQGSAPGSSIDGSLVDYQQPLASFDADRIQAETLRIDEIPAFVQGTSYPSGTLTVYVVGSCARVYGAHLDVVLPKGYQDVLRIDNGARGEGDSVEIAIGRQTADVAYYQSFLQGLLLDSGSLITAFSDANFTTAMDYLALISRDYALSAALPRALAKGTVYLESSIGMPPLVFAKGGLNYWLETWAWNLYEDELEIDARTLPSASLTVQSETILESDGSTVSSSSSGSSGGGSSISPGGGTNYFQIDDDLQTLLEPKPQFDFLSPKKGLIFGTTEETDVASSPAHLMLRNLGTAQSPNYALYTPYALITGGDQIVGSGTPGGGGGGAGYLYELGDIYHDTDKTKVLRTDGTTPAAVGDVLQLTSLTGGNKWAAVPATDIGRVYSGGTGITINPNTNEISVTANTYLPLAGGILTGLLTCARSDDNIVLLLQAPSSSTRTWLDFQVGSTRIGTIGVDTDHNLLFHDRTDTRTVYHSGNVDNFFRSRGKVANSSVSANDLKLGTWFNNVATTNFPYQYGILFSFDGAVSDSTYDGYYLTQFYQSAAADNTLWYRSKRGTTWGSWVSIWHTGNSGTSTTSWTCSDADVYGNVRFKAIGTGTYNIGFLGQSSSSCYFELPLATDSATGTKIPFFISWRGGGTYPFYISASDRVGIGTNSPSYKLDVNGTLNATTIYQNGTSLSTILSDYVTLAGTQTITGNKTFSGTFCVSNSTVANVDLIVNSVLTGRFYANSSSRVSIENPIGLNQQISLLTGYSYPVYRNNGTDYTIYHSGNSNNRIVSWSCSVLNVNRNESTGAMASSGTALEVQGYASYVAFKTYMANGSGSSTSVSTNHLVLDNQGYVGIGTSSPATKLDVRSSDAGIISLVRTAANGGACLDFYANNQTTHKWRVIGDYSNSDYCLRFTYDSTTNVHISSAGNVGIGTTSPVSKLDVRGDITLGANSLVFTTNDATTWATTQNSGLRILNSIASAVTGAPGQYYTGLSVWGYYGFQIASSSNSNTFKMRGSSAAAGTYASWVTLYHSGNSNLYNVNWTCASAYVYGNVDFLASGTGTYNRAQVSVNTSRMYLELPKATDSSSGTNVPFYICWRGGGTRAIYINPTGYVGICKASGSTPSQALDVTGTIVSTGDQVISSDERLKTHIEPVKLTVEQIAGMRAVTYDRTDSGLHSLGVIAQDWEKVLPESVNQGEYLTFKYAQTAMVSAIVLAKHETEQDKEIKKLREKVQKLEEDNLRLKARLNMS